MSRGNNVRAAFLVITAAIALIVYGFETQVDVAEAVAILLLAFVIGDGFCTYYGFYRLPSAILSRRLVGSKKL